jgi:hypothetical protein
MKISVQEVGVAEDGICALDTNGKDLPVGEYEVDLVWQYWNGEYEKWISLPEERKAMYANSFWEFSNFAAKTRQIYIASVAPESKEVKEKIICGQTCDCQSGDDCNFGDIDRSNWNFDPVKASPDLDASVSVKNLTELSLTHAIEACKNIKNPTKREAAILSSAHDYRTGYTAALSVKSTHVPIEEVEAILKEAYAKNFNMGLYVILEKISSLIKPQ